MKGFLFGQTEYNMFNNTIRLADYIEAASNKGFDFLSITDSNLYGHYKFYKACLVKNIKPIIGLSHDFIDEDGKDTTYLFYPYNNLGFKNLLKISTIANTTILNSIEAVEKYFEGIHIVVSFANSILERYILLGNQLGLDAKINKFEEKGYYLGISKTNDLSKVGLISQIEEIVKSTSLIILPLHNTRYLVNSDIKAYEALCLIGDKKVSLSEFEDYSFPDTILVSDELSKFISSINIKLYDDKLALPKYPNTKGVSSKEYLSALAYKGLEKRICNYNNIYRQRLEYELSVIDKMGYNDYFLIVWDFIKFSKQNEILVGPGRGSAAGSLVAYCLGITEIDPLRYNLLFERFLNPERVSMPDIDVDFPDNKRDMVIEYVKNLFGIDHICNISAYGTFQLRSCIRDLGRVLKITNDRIDELINIVANSGFEKAIEDYNDRDEIASFLMIASKLNGLPRHVSTHAAGIILSDLNLNEIIPLQSGINGLYQSQLEAHDLESIGLLKMDFLGIRNLAMIDEMVRTIRGKFDLDFLRAIPLNDRKTFDLLKAGDTLGIFQLESSGITNVLKKLKPTVFEEIVAVLALYRPGPMDNIDEFIARKNHKEFSYLHPCLEPILKETYGIIVYQEQIMLIATTFAGYSLGEADVLRRAVSKKDSKTLEKLENDFITKSIKMGHNDAEAKTIYDLIYKFADYGFNKSHSVAYAVLSYWMTYLKANHFDIFMANMLNYVISDISTLAGYIKYSKLHGLNIIKPSINKSATSFVTTNTGLYIPLTVIYSIGLITANQIIEERKLNGSFKSYNEFISRCSFLSDSNIEALAYAGAFDEFKITKKSMIENKNKASNIFLKYLTDVIEDTSEYDEIFLMEQEKKYLGINIEYDIFKNYFVKLKATNTICLQNSVGLSAKFLISFIKAKEIKTKTKEKMLVGELTDNNMVMDTVMFPSAYNALNEKIQVDILYIVSGRIGLNKDKKLQLVIDSLSKM